MTKRYPPNNFPKDLTSVGRDASAMLQSSGGLSIEPSPQAAHHKGLVRGQAPQRTFLEDQALQRKEPAEHLEDQLLRPPTHSGATDGLIHRG